MNEHKIEDGVNVVVDEIEHFFLEAESFVEKIIFGKRLWVLLAFLLVTAFLASAAIKVRPDASFEKMVPVKHPFWQAPAAGVNFARKYPIAPQNVESYCYTTKDQWCLFQKFGSDSFHRVIDETNYDIAPESYA